MSPQKKLILRRNALFRQQLSTTAACCPLGQGEHLLHCTLPDFNIQLEMENPEQSTAVNDLQTHSAVQH